MSQRGMTINIRPVTKGRPRLGRRRKAFTPQKTVEFEAAIADAWDRCHPNTDPLDGPLGMEVVIESDHIHIEIWELAESHRPKYVTGDVDNYQKSISDALNGHAYLDDKQLHHINVYLTKEITETL